MAQTVIDYKDEAAGFGIIIMIGLFFLFIVGEPFIEVWKFTINFTMENITKVRFFVYSSAVISVGLLILIFGLIYAEFGKLKAFLFFIILHLLDLAITDNNILIQFLIKTIGNLANWLFGNV